MIKTHSRYYNKSQHSMKMRENKLRDKLNMTCIIKNPFLIYMDCLNGI